MKTSNRLANRTATVLVTVIMLITAMSALSVGILSAMGSQGVFGQNQVDRIKAEQLAKGYFWKTYYETALGGTASTIPTSVTMDGKTYTSSITTGTANSGPNGTTPISMIINY